MGFSRDGTSKTNKTRLVRARADRRNTVDCAILNQMIIEPTIGDSKRSDKKTLQLARNEERDSKLLLSVSSATTSYRVSNTTVKRSSGTFEDRAESLPATKKAQAIPKLIESCNRFMSVKSRPIGCRTSAPASAFANAFKEATQMPVMGKTDNATIGGGGAATTVSNNRIDFHDTFSHLIKLGSIDKTSKGLVSHVLFLFF